MWLMYRQRYVQTTTGASPKNPWKHQRFPTSPGPLTGVQHNAVTVPSSMVACPLPYLSRLSLCCCAKDGVRWHAPAWDQTHRAQQWMQHHVMMHKSGHKNKQTHQLIKSSSVSASVPMSCLVSSALTPGCYLWPICKLQNKVTVFWSARDPHSKLFTMKMPSKTTTFHNNQLTC